LEIKLLADRLVSEVSYEELAKRHNTTPEMIGRIFEATLNKIERTISKGIARHLRVIDIKLRQRPDKPFSVIEFHLN
jgi:transcriptional regulator GlxA family with amidase domain